MSDPKSARITVRPAQPDEAVAIGDVVARVFVEGGFTPAERTQRLRDTASRVATGTVFVAVDAEGALVGSIAFVPGGGGDVRIATADEAEMQMLAVLPEARGLGAGGALVAAFLAEAKARGYRRTVLSTQPSMTSAHRIYEAAGFRRTPERDWTRDSGRPMWAYERKESAGA